MSLWVIFVLSVVAAWLLGYLMGQAFGYTSAWQEGWEAAEREFYGAGRSMCRERRRCS